MPSPIAEAPSCPVGFTPAHVAASQNIDVGKVLDWIHAGELIARNLATRSGGRPRWRISPEHLEAFLLRRQSSAPPKIRKRSKPRRVKSFV
jgi:hypothetical protein